MKKHTIFVLFTGLLLSACSHAFAQTIVATKVLKDSLFIPWEIIYGPDDHIWFTQKNGYICRMDTAGVRLDTLYHEAKTLSLKEAGMLGMALHPNFAAHPYVYVTWEYKDTSGNIWERVERYTYAPTINQLTEPHVLLDSIHGYRYHNGCRLLIVEDKLFITIADATDSTNPQNLSKLNGKILRLNLDGSIPADNPLPGSPIWSWGHRNPQGLVYANGILYSSEHGDNTDDEVNIIKRAGNYGWPYVRGNCDKAWEMQFCADSPVIAPMHFWTPTIAPCGIDYYDQQMFPTLQNSILLTTLKDKHLYQLQLNDAHDAITNISIVDGISFGRLRDICVSPEGKIFISTSNSDPNDTGKKVDRIVAIYNPNYAGEPTQPTIYPNPATDQVQLNIPGKFNTAHYMVCNTNGKQMAEGTLHDGRPGINISSWPPGVYFLRLDLDGTRRFSGSFVKVRW